jgi:hypothetical protein
MADEQIHDARLGIWQALEEQPEPRPEKCETGHLERKPSVPRHLEGEVAVRVGVEVEPREGKDDVVDFVSAREVSRGNGLRGTDSL